MVPQEILRRQICNLIQFSQIKSEQRLCHQMIRRIQKKQTSYSTWSSDYDLLPLLPCRHASLRNSIHKSSVRHLENMDFLEDLILSLIQNTEVRSSSDYPCRSLKEGKENPLFHLEVLFL